MFVSIYERDMWFKKVTVEDIKNCFKIAAFVEKTMEKMSSLNCVDLFVESLTKYWENNGRSNNYQVDFFKRCSDRLLEKFLTTKIISLNNADIALRIYTSMLPRERLTALLSDLIITSKSHDAILEFLLQNRDVCAGEIEARLTLNDWTNFLTAGKKQIVQETVSHMMSAFQVGTSLPTLIKILSLPDVNCNEMTTINVILDTLTVHMQDRSALSKKFWSTLFKETKLDDVIGTCGKHERFLEDLLNFVIYICSMMDCITNDAGNWSGDVTASICPEINYADVIRILNGLTHMNCNVRELVRQKIDEAQVNTECAPLWARMLSDLEFS